MPLNPGEQTRLMHGETLIHLSFMPDDVIAVNGSILCNAEPRDVWQSLTDYDHLSDYLPKVVASRVTKRTDEEIILEQTGKTGIFIFEKTVHFRLKVQEEKEKKVLFEQLDGDFTLYRGEWMLETDDALQGTILSYHAEIKPRFFAPPILVSFVEWQDLPGILKAHKQRSESISGT
ncbi:MAG: SRPBCC family protein [Chlorobiaceae bacterium]